MSVKTMSIIGFNFTKVDVERKNASAKKITINNNIGISSIEESEVNISGAGSKPVKFNFFFHCQFEPNVGHIKLDGEVIALFPEDESKKILADWKAKKNVPADSATKVLNTALSKAQIMSLTLAKDVNLPSPVQLPKVVPKHDPAPEKK